ncbi:MAG: DNA primase [Rickettsiales bacterium]|jgi:DNA primase|nr:DNA primase [Rickettsiales bacterium]
MANDYKSFRDELLGRISIVDVVGRRVPLKAKGQHFWGCCPFHNEKTPSFSVSEEKGFYHCFGCGAHGGAIDFLMKTENLPFMEAMEHLAQMAGMEMPKFAPVDPAQAARAMGYVDIMAEAAQIYSQALFQPEGKQALEYLRGRGFTDEMIGKYQLGFAPKGNKIAAKFAGRDRKLLLSTGIVRPSNTPGGADYDFFRGRVMFPILDAKNRVIAFSGRSMDGEEPKYINIAETEFFHKRRTLYGFNFARSDIIKNRRAIVVEGQIDALQMQCAGFGETIAPLGSALTDDHAQILLKITKSIVLCFDGDNAGKKAAARAVDVILPFMTAEMDIKILTLPGGKDPDDIIRNSGAAGMQDLLNGATPLPEYLWNMALNNFAVQTPNGRALAEKFLIERSDMIGDDTLRRHMFTTLKNMMWDNWKGGKTISKTNIKIPVIKTEEDFLSEIAETYPELRDKYFELFASKNCKKAGVKTTIPEQDAEKFIRKIKLKDYISGLKADYEQSQSATLLSEIVKMEKALEELV